MPDLKPKKIALALQGGGSHGAYTWGVLDALLEHTGIEVEGVSGTSAGGMNATALAQGAALGSNQLARETLTKLWKNIGEQGKNSILQPNPLKKLVKDFNLSDNPIYLLMNYIGNVLSPYQLNPQNIHPLRGMVTDLFDFKSLQSTKKCKLFLCATHVATGKLKIFTGPEISPDTILASACVPNLFQAIEVEGEFYWDGGFIGNPAIYPLIYQCETPDIIVIQIRRVHDPKIPTTVHDIQNRLGEITQNACLTREMRSIEFISNLIDNGTIPKGKLKRLHMHLIRDDAFFGDIDRASGFCADPDFLDYLFKAGRRMGVAWLEKNYDKIGKESTANIEEDFI